jgi:hypothetical protein
MHFSFQALRLFWKKAISLLAGLLYSFAPIVIIRLLKGDIKANSHHELAVAEQANHASHQRKPANTIQKNIFLYFSPFVAMIFTSPPQA